MTDAIQKQTKALSDQVELLERLSNEGDTDKYLLELEKYHLMLKGSDFSIESQAASKKKELTKADKFFAPKINRITKTINKVNRKLEERNKKKACK